MSHDRLLSPIIIKGFGLRTADGRWQRLFQSCPLLPISLRWHFARPTAYILSGKLTICIEFHTCSVTINQSLSKHCREDSRTSRGGEGRVGRFVKSTFWNVERKHISRLRNSIAPLFTSVISCQENISPSLFFCRGVYIDLMSALCCTLKFWFKVWFKVVICCTRKVMRFMKDFAEVVYRTKMEILGHFTTRFITRNHLTSQD